MASWIVIILSAYNAILGFMFSSGVGKHSAPWKWPPTWFRVVANWLGAKSFFFLVSIGLCWIFHIVGFTHHPRFVGIPHLIASRDFPGLRGWHGEIIYIVPLTALVIFQTVVAVYLKTGRAVIQEETKDA